MKLHEFLAEIGRAGAKAADAAHGSVESWFRQHCDELDDGTLVPKTIDMELNIGAVTLSAPIPEVCLTNPPNLDMSTLDVEFETMLDLQRVEVDSSNGDVPPADVRVELKKGLTKAETLARVKAQFKLGEPPEAMEVLRDRLVDLVRDQLRV